MKKVSEPEMPLDATQSADGCMIEHVEENPFNNQKSLAATATGHRKVFLVAKTGCFRVEGSKGDKYAVTLAPTERSHCLALGTCYHNLAARKAVGLDDSVKLLLQICQDLSREHEKKSKICYLEGRD